MYTVHSFTNSSLLVQKHGDAVTTQAKVTSRTARLTSVALPVVNVLHFAQSK